MMLKKPVLLMVCEDKKFLALLYMLFRRNGYEVVLVSNTYEALDILRDRSIDMIIVDDLTSEKTELEILEKSRSYCPHIIRVMLSSCHHLLNVKQMIEHGVIEQYIENSWDDNQLVACVNESFARHQKRTENIYEFFNEKNSREKELVKRL